ncbi:hypothetical protein [Fibrella aestuarina]|uniref:hypothetical protein n=1 Tax=Fibrella aestuarina TaxID=651143 RepID=UPI00059E82C2|nr:hypothetical protein [Fibrella aestuarina]
MKAKQLIKWSTLSCLFTALACQQAVELTDEPRNYCNVWTDAAKTDRIKQAILGTWQFTQQRAGFSGQSVQTSQTTRLTFTDTGELIVGKNSAPAKSLSYRITEEQVAGFDKPLLRLTLNDTIPAINTGDVAINSTYFYVCNDRLVFDNGSWFDAPTETFVRLH